VAPINPTKSQQTAIDARGKTILVSAAAGSGKTAVLVERVISRITDKDNPVDADSLLIVTFTKAAAAEMRQRINDRLGDELAKKPGDIYLQKQQMKLLCAHICTIDAFCLDLVNEYFYELGLPPNVKIASKGIIAQMEFEALTGVIEAAYERDEPGLKPLVEMLGTSRGDKALEDVIKKIYEFINAIPFGEKWLDKAVGMYAPKAHVNDYPWAEMIYKSAQKKLAHELENITALLPELHAEEKLWDKRGKPLSDFGDQIKILLAAIEARDWDKCHMLAHTLTLNGKTLLRGCVYPELKIKADYICENCKGLSKSLPEMFLASNERLLKDIALQRPYLELLTGLVRDFMARAGELKAQRNLLDFSDIEHCVCRLLVKSADGGQPELTGKAGEIAAQYSEVMVDEYQDTNDLQDMIFYALSDRGKKLFMVGDAKQSIYAFRQANPKNFIGRREEYPPITAEGGNQGLILLDDNFRSRSSVTNFVNYIFSQILKKETGDISYNGGEALNPKAVYPGYERDTAELHILQTGKDDDGNAARQEARYIAGVVKRMVGGGFMVAVNPKNAAQGMRPVQYRDFCILSRSMSGGRNLVLVEELAKAGIPAWADIKEGFFQSPEIALMLNLLRLIDNPLLDVPMLAVLLSEIGGFSADGAARLRLCKKDGSLYGALSVFAERDQKAAGFMELLVELRTFGATLPIDALIEKIYDTTGYLAASQAYPDGELRRANLMLLLQRAAEFEDGGFRGLSSFVRYVDRLTSGGEDLKPAAVSGESENVVKIMTVHRSKGLQFRIVILAGANNAFKLNDTGYSSLSREGGIACKIADDLAGTVYGSLPFAANRELIAQGNLAEELRILYVALTRAEEKLILVGSMAKPEEKIRQLACEMELSEGNILRAQSVLGCKSYFSWVMMCCLRHGASNELKAQIGIALLSADGTPPLFTTPSSADATPPRRGILGTENNVKLSILMATPGVCEQETERVEQTSVPPNPELVAELQRRLSYEYPFARLNQIYAKMSVSQVSEKLQNREYTCTARPAFLSAKGLTPAQRGTALHEFLQFCDFDRSRTDLPGELKRLQEQQFLLPEQIDALDAKKIRAFFDSPLFRRIESSRYLREQRFTYAMPPGLIDPELADIPDREQIVLQGVADLVFFEHDGMVIVDYKTDRIKSPGVLLERYGKQLEIYKYALGDIFGCPVKECLLYSFELGEEIRV